MKIASRIQVEEFDASSVVSFDWHAGSSSRIPRYSARALGLVGTLLLHGIVVVTAATGSGRHKVHQPDSLEAGFISPVESAERMELVTINTTATIDMGLAGQIAALSPSIEAPEYSVANPDLVSVSDIADNDDALGVPNAASDAGDATQRALMFGRYTGQISARIERAWIRPRTPVMDGSLVAARTSAKGGTAGDIFTCRVQIRQDAEGNVREVLLLNCPGTEDWRHSLVVAIYQSSPLPAPPVPSVFESKLAMTFEAHTFREGDPPYAYQAAVRPNEDRSAENNQMKLMN